MGEQQTGYEIDRGRIQVAWLRFIKQHPEVGMLGRIHQCANFNSWLRIRENKQVRAPLFDEAISDLIPYWRRGRTER